MHDFINDISPLPEIEIIAIRFLHWYYYLCIMLEKIQKINILQRIWIFIIGTKKPNLLTQISVAIALCIWFYFFSWNLMSFLSMVLMDTLDHANELEMAFNRVGGRYQYFLHGNITTWILVHAFLQIILSALSLIGLILIWRQIKSGFMLYIFSNAAVYVVMFFVMGPAYIWHETSLVDFVLLLMITLYFLTGYWLFYKK